jgi:Ca-activated chloride channel family protein
VRVFTVGFGTLEGATIGFEGWSAYVRLDEEALKAVASITRGEYYHASTATDLKKVYQDLNSRFVLERKDTEVTSLFSAAAALLAALAGVLSIAWFGRFS